MQGQSKLLDFTDHRSQNFPAVHTLQDQASAWPGPLQQDGDKACVEDLQQLQLLPTLLVSDCLLLRRCALLVRRIGSCCKATGSEATCGSFDCSLACEVGSDPCCSAAADKLGSVAAAASLESSPNMSSTLVSASV